MIDHEIGAGAQRPVEVWRVGKAVGYPPDCEVIEERPEPGRSHPHTHQYDWVPFALKRSTSDGTRVTTDIVRLVNREV